MHVARYDVHLLQTTVVTFGGTYLQVEGAVAEDGRTPSVWDIFTHYGTCQNHDVAYFQLPILLFCYQKKENYFMKYVRDHA